MSGNLTVTAGILSMDNYAFTVTGSTSVTGTINTITGATGTRTFTGTVTVNSGGTFSLTDQDPVASFGAGITQNSGNAIYLGNNAVTLVGNLSGSGVGTIDFGSGISLTIPSGTTTNNFTGGTVFMGGTMALNTGNWTQGTNSTLTLSQDAPFSGSGTFTASATGNSVSYNSSTPTIYATTYHDLSVAGVGTNSGTVTINASLEGIGTFVNGATGTLNIGFASAPGITTLTATASGNTVNYTAAAPNCRVVAYHHLNFTGSGAVTCAVTTVGGNLGTSGTVSWTTSSDIVVTGDLTVDTGTSLAGTNNITVNGGDVTGDGDINLTGGTVIINTAGNFGGATAWDFYNLTIGAAGNAITTATGAGGITVTNILTIDTGDTLDAKGKTWTLSNASGANSAPLVISGTLDDTTDTSTFAFIGNCVTSCNTSIPASAAYNNLTFNNASEVYVTAGAITTSGDVTITNGEFTAPSGNLTLGKNFTNNGTFTHSSGTVVVSPVVVANPIVIAGTSITTFNNFTATVVGTTLQFKAGQRTGFAGTMTVQGTQGHPVYIQSDTFTSQWELNLSGTASILYAIIRDSGCYGGTNNVNQSDTNQNYGGNTATCWRFVGQGGGTYEGQGGGTPQSYEGTDTFERAGPALGSNWNTSHTACVPEIFNSSDFGGGSTNVRCLATWTAATFGNDQFSEITITSFTTNDQVAAVVRLSNGDNFYALVSDGASFLLREFVGGSGATLVDLSTPYPVAGDTIRLEAEGSTLRAYRNGSLRGTTTDTSFTSGANGAYTFRADQGPTSRIEYWHGGSLNVQGGGSGGVSCEGSSGLCDDFERVSLGSNWTVVAGTPQIYSSSDFGGATADAYNLVYWSGSSLSNNQYSEVIMSALPASHQVIAAVRVADASNFYGLRATTTSFEIFKVVSGTPTVLLDLSTPYPTATDTIRLEVSGTTLKAYINGVLRNQTTDSSLASGSPGVSVYLSGGTPTSRVELWRASSASESGGGEGGGGGGATP
ncbi:MAG: hypothetical protein A2441_02165 [Candidatus Veblenbacteria bacterium RIFOXYC2_FULL_42_11]|uniref:Uncharacterized protein n=1 Tax=Candidatus Veblenbacteria bacterium RIFOXYC2_FULL_42_11 TaxID=1802428 RepID=A0A1G2Q7N9_9BACT|nr:MAG: hypothetical protein A2441_02165 [Candidatus Veblenbacteria bacterium RIFOXYC2_FULL_42_11]